MVFSLVDDESKESPRDAYFVVPAPQAALPGWGPQAQKTAALMIGKHFPRFFFWRRQLSCVGFSIARYECFCATKKKKHVFRLGFFGWDPLGHRHRTIFFDALGRRADLRNYSWRCCFRHVSHRQCCNVSRADFPFCIRGRKT